MKGSISNRQIEFALKNCTQSDCRECPYKYKHCISTLHQDALRYINRLKQKNAIMGKEEKNRE